MKRDDLDDVDRHIFGTTHAGASRTAADSRLFDRVEQVLADVAPEQVTWLWPGYLPAGKLVVLDGDPSVGKSTLALDLAARCHAAPAMPDGTTGRAGSVILMSAEDGLADTIRPRLDAAGADVANVVAITAITVTATASRSTCGRRRSPTTSPSSRHPSSTTAPCSSSSTCSPPTCRRRRTATGIRTCAAPSPRWRRWPNAPAAASSCCAISARRRPASAIYAGGGSIAIVGAARVGLMAAFDPDDDEVDDLNERRRVLAVVKNNVGRMAPSLSYRIVEAGHGVADRVARPGHPPRRRPRRPRAAATTSAATRRRSSATCSPTARCRQGRREGAARANGWTIKQLRPTLKRIGGRARQSRVRRRPAAGCGACPTSSRCQRSLFEKRECFGIYGRSRRREEFDEWERF